LIRRSYEIRDLFGGNKGADLSWFVPALERLRPENQYRA